MEHTRPRETRQLVTREAHTHGTRQLVLPFLCASCGARLHGHGWDRQLGFPRKRSRCPDCRRVYVEQPRNGRLLNGRFMHDNGYACIYAKNYPRRVNPEFLNSGGWQYEHRLVVMEALGRRLRTDEHVDHINGNKLDNRLENLRVVLAPEHGRRHKGITCYTVVAETVDGEFREVLDVVHHADTNDDDIPF